MSGSKVYVRKPHRRYERDFSAPQEETGGEGAPGKAAEVNPDITAPVNTKTALQPEMRNRGAGAPALKPLRPANPTGKPGDRRKRQRPDEPTG